MQVVKEYTGKVDNMLSEKKESQKAKEAAAKVRQSRRES